MRLRVRWVCANIHTSKTDRAISVWVFSRSGAGLCLKIAQLNLSPETADSTSFDFSIKTELWESFVVPCSIFATLFYYKGLDSSTTRTILGIILIKFDFRDGNSNPAAVSCTTWWALDAISLERASNLCECQSNVLNANKYLAYACDGTTGDAPTRSHRTHIELVFRVHY